MDLIFFNGNVLTLDSKGTKASAVAVKWDRIFKVGADKDILSLVDSNTKTIDLNGETLLPGFIDTHNHLSFYGYLVSSVDCRAASGVQKNADVIGRLRAEADKTPAGQWVKGWGYAHYHLEDNRPLTRTDLDKVSEKHPILVIQISGHAGTCNSRALEIFGYTKETPDPPGGAIQRDPKTGEPNGILDESALMNQVNGLFMQEFLMRPLDDRMQMIETAVEHYTRAGITMLHEAYVTPQTLQLYQEMERRGKLKLRIYTMNIDYMASTLLDAGIVLGYGSPLVKVGPIKMFIDGGMSNRTAAVSKPYEGTSETGIYLSTPEELFEKVERFHTAGYQIAVHAQGDAAIGTLLDAYERVLGKRSDNPLRHRIEHCGNITEEQIERAASMNIYVSSQPMFFSHLGDGFLEAFGLERGHRLYPYRSLMQHGIHLAGASDCPVAPALPLLGIRDAIVRKTGSGADFGPEERLGIDDALALYTSEAAHFSFDEERMGTLEPGKYADLVVLDRDITQVSPEQIPDAQVLMTVLGGDIVFSTGT
jgi:predicted amidohydrolase YtcJ